VRFGRPGIVLALVVLASTVVPAVPAAAAGNPCRHGNHETAPDGRIGYGSEFRYGASFYPGASQLFRLRRGESATMYMRWKNVAGVTQTIEVVPTRLEKTSVHRVRYSVDGENIGREVRDRDVFSFVVPPLQFTGMFRIDVRNEGTRHDVGHIQFVGRYAGAGARECDLGQLDINRIDGDAGS
jgi:hypothetical protein